MKLIDASRLINETDDRYTLNEIGRRERDDIVNALEFAPTVDAVLVRHGKWVDEGYYADNTNFKAWHCSECSWHMLGYEDELFRFCPMCGSRMDGDETD